jgi:SPOR domain
MADRYQSRPFPADDYDHGGDQYGSGRLENDPLAELARLIGQSDPFAAPIGRANHKAQPQVPPRVVPRDQYQAPQYEEPQYDDLPEEVEEPSPQPGPPSWLQRANVRPVQDIPQQPEEPHYQPNSVHPLHRYAAPQPAPAAQPYQAEHYEEEPAYDLEQEQQADSARYDNALYGRIETGAQDYQRAPAYPDDPYAYQEGYEDEPEEQGRRRGGGLITVVAVLALAVVGTGAAFAYRTYVGSPRSGEPPIIRADNTPTKIIPAGTDTSAKAPDRLPSGNGTEKIVSREETPVDVNARAAGPRVVFPPLNQNANPPSPASVATTSLPPNAAMGTVPSNGTLPNNEPRRIKTLSVRGDPEDSGAPAGVAAPPPATRSAAAPKVAAPAVTAPHGSPSNANASANAPMSLAPQGGQPAAETKVASTNPTAIVPPQGAGANGGGNFLVQISSQPSEAEAQASYRSLQGKYPDVLASHSPVIKRVELAGKGTVYRAMVGPFASRDEAARFCTSYRTAGGQCWVP